MQPFGSIVKPEIGQDSPNSLPVACSQPVDIFEAALEARIAQALAIGDFRQAALAVVAHPGALLLPEFVYASLSAIGHATRPLEDLETGAVELAAQVVMRVAENSRNSPENQIESEASVLQGRAAT